MIFTEFEDKKLSLLGMGGMRFPTLENGEIDEKQTEEMIRVCIENGVNYFDTSWTYHGGQSEVVLGKLLKKFPKDKWFLADKYPGHNIASTYNPAKTFEEQLRRCGVDRFDFYLMHNVYENSIDVYLDPKWGMVDYFIEQKKIGRVGHLGFSCHGSPEVLKRFLEAYGEHMEFCQIQLNWLDWTLQDANEKVKILNEYNIPVWVMEPVRGGRLCTLNAEDEAKLKALRPDETIPAWGFRFLQDIKGVQMVLSGMSNMAQVEDNLKTFESAKPLTDAEKETLLSIAEGMKDSVPCTECRYCTEKCPLGLDIPMLIKIYNEVRFYAHVSVGMRLEGLPYEKTSAACIGCGACAKMCPQLINIPSVMKDLTERLKDIPKWTEICRAREEAAKKAEEEK